MTLGWPRCRDCGHRVQSDLGQSTQRLPGAGTHGADARAAIAAGSRGPTEDILVCDRPQ